MTNGLDETLAALLRRELPSRMAEQVQTSFAAPDDQFPQNTRVTMKDLYEACRLHSNVCILPSSFRFPTKRIAAGSGKVSGLKPCRAIPAWTSNSWQGVFQVTGGNIRNIALSAAFLAADVMGMQHVIRATQREYHKMGKVITDGEFREYTHASMAQ